MVTKALNSGPRLSAETIGRLVVRASDGFLVPILIKRCLILSRRDVTIKIAGAVLGTPGAHLVNDHA